jgi:hypothetical protein
LRHAERQATVYGRFHRQILEEPTIHADDRIRAEIPATMDRLSQHMGTVVPMKVATFTRSLTESELPAASG